MIFSISFSVMGFVLYLKRLCTLIQPLIENKSISIRPYRSRFVNHLLRKHKNNYICKNSRVDIRSIRLLFTLRVCINHSICGTRKTGIYRFQPLIAVSRKMSIHHGSSPGLSLGAKSSSICSISGSSI